MLRHFFDWTVFLLCCCHGVHTGLTWESGPWARMEYFRSIFPSVVSPRNSAFFFFDLTMWLSCVFITSTSLAQMKMTVGTWWRAMDITCNEFERNTFINPRCTNDKSLVVEEDTHRTFHGRALRYLHNFSSDWAVALPSDTLQGGGCSGTESYPHVQLETCTMRGCKWHWVVTAFLAMTCMYCWRGSRSLIAVSRRMKWGAFGGGDPLGHPRPWPSHFLVQMSNGWELGAIDLFLSKMAPDPLPLGPLASRCEGPLLTLLSQ